MVDSKEGAVEGSEALTARQRVVTLPDGTVVTIEKWAWAKMKALYACAGDFEKIPFIAEQSVLPEDREKVRHMNPEDLIEVASAAVDFNVTPRSAKNLLTLVRAWGAISEGERTDTPSK